MLGIGMGEMLIIAAIALVAIGPEKFPDFAKMAIKTIRDLRGYMDDVKTEVAKELAPVKKEVRELSKYKPEDYIDAMTGEGRREPASGSEPIPDPYAAAKAETSPDAYQSAEGAIPETEPAGDETSECYVENQDKPEKKSAPDIPERLDG